MIHTASMKRILIIMILLICSCCHPTQIEDSTLDTYDNTCLLNDNPTFLEYLNGLESDTSKNDFATKRGKILSAMAEYFWHNTFAKDLVGPQNPAVVGVSYEKKYGEFELYCIYQSNVWTANHNKSITSIDHRQDYYIAYSMNGEPPLPISERLDSAHSQQPTCINEISYYLAIRDNPFQYYAIANVYESGRQVLSIIDSLVNK